MTKSLLEDAFGHHVWATQRLLDTCSRLSADQMATSAPGTYGSIIETMRHIVGADSSYLSAMTGGSVPRIEESGMSIPELQTTMEGNGDAWASLLARELDPNSDVVRLRDDGTESHAPLGIRLAQALHHGTDHRSQICTALTTISTEPPAIDVWDFAEEDGRLVEIPPS